MDASLAENRGEYEHQKSVGKSHLSFVINLIHDLSNKTFGESGESGKTEAELAKFALKIRNKLYAIHLEEEDVKMIEKCKLTENIREQLLAHFRRSRRRREIIEEYKQANNS